MTQQSPSYTQIQVLVVEDQKVWQKTTVELVSDVLATLFPNVDKKNLVRFFIASNLEEAKDILDSRQIHICLLDKDLGSDQSGKPINSIDSIAELKSIQPFCQVVMLTADNSILDIARAIRNGASDYLFKSNKDGHREYRVQVLARALKTHAEQIAIAKARIPGKRGLYSNYVCRSPAMQRFDNKLTAIAESGRPVLLLGDSGLGKGAGARRLSELRRLYLGQTTREFIQVNLGALEKAMADAELFGTEPGAFTDAAKVTKPGRLDLARDGDVFVDEVGDASLDLQLKLMKVVEEKEYCRVGGTKTIKTNARFIFATNKDIQALIKAKQFREDFYMRISVFEETVPPLCERREDVPLIVQGYLEAACSESKSKTIHLEDIPADLMNYFQRGEIVGNFRGIEKDIEKLVAHTKYDESGRPRLEAWKQTLEIQTAGSSRKPQTFGLEQLLTTKTNFLNKDFPGLWEATQIFERRILEEVEAKGLTIEQAAKLLKVSVNTVWSRKKQFQAQASGV